MTFHFRSPFQFLLPAVMVTAIANAVAGEETRLPGTEPLTAADIADTVYWVATRPAHVNINSVQMMPVCQAFGPLAVKRNN